MDASSPAPPTFELIEELSADEIERFLSFLPEETRAQLAEGPWPEPHCGVCRALDHFTSSGPAMTLMDYHDTPFRRHFGTRHYREGREVYRRCCEIYRAAGWTGDANELADPQAQVAADMQREFRALGRRDGFRVVE